MTSEAARDRQVARETVRPRSECASCNPGQPADHRLRVRPQVYPLTGVVWGCSCGVSDTAVDRETAEAVHAAHAMTAGAQ